MSDISVGDCARRVQRCNLDGCEESWHQVGWEGVVIHRSDTTLYFAEAGAQGLTDRHVRVSGSTEREPGVFREEHEGEPT